MPLTEGQKQSRLKYAQKTYKRVPLDIQKDKYEQIKAAADAAGESINGYIKTAIDNRMTSISFNTEQKQFGFQRNPEEQLLIDIVYDNEDLFNDMIFGEGSSTYNLVAIQSSRNSGETWEDDSIILPDLMAYYSTSWFSFYVKDILPQKYGEFNGYEQSITVDPQAINESVILHEMIHMHEFVLDECPKIYHEICMWSIYRSLKEKIPDLDDRIESHAHLSNQEIIAGAGGAHDILFLLKSFDLDFKKGYKLGTIFGYGYAEE